MSKKEESEDEGGKGSLSLIPGITPAENEVRYTIGPYQVLSTIGKGGMGEVILAYDTTCGRRIALKKIRSDLVQHTHLYNRFLKEARITSQLTHPTIIPIYTINDEKGQSYYTMPYVEGETLRQLLRKTRQAEKNGIDPQHIGGSIPSLIRIFLTICQAIAYAHSKGVLHRDLKPENVIVGQYGEVLILDWGLAKLMSEVEAQPLEVEEIHGPRHITRIGKVVGTISYMAPERARDLPASIQTDIYSLGVILYQLLTLQIPFVRGSLKEFRQTMEKEVLQDPAEVAPYREVPRVLARISKRCLEPNPKDRYETVDALIHDIENYIEGRSEWFEITELNIENKEDWEFQENVLIAEHIAITRHTEVSDWVNLMISKASFPGNMKLEVKVKLGPTGQGIGFLLSVPEASERLHLNDGYCLWLGSDSNRSTKLLRATAEVVSSPDIFLEKDSWHRIRIEKLDNKIYLYLDDILQLSYLGHLPLAGTHVGLLFKDADYEVEHFHIFVGSHSVTVNCLAVPDAFLAHKEYATALIEYRRIGYSFPGRAEGREAKFRAGITLVEQARNCQEISQQSTLYDLALAEFEKLHATPGAPLEYLGKALVYKAMGEYEEEVKCFELAYRRYRNHPLLPILKEQIIYRMHEASRSHRQLTYHFALLLLCHLQDAAFLSSSQKLFENLKNHWELLPSILTHLTVNESEEIHHSLFGISLAFWLAKPHILYEIIEKLYKNDNPVPALIGDALYCLVELGAYHQAEYLLDHLSLDSQMRPIVMPIKLSLTCHRQPLEEVKHTFIAQNRSYLTEDDCRFLTHLMDCLVMAEQTLLIYELIDYLRNLKYPPKFHLSIDCYQITALLIDKRWEEAGNCLHEHSLTDLTDKKNPLNYLYGCLLAVTEGEEIAYIHFSAVLDIPYPHTSALLSYYQTAPSENVNRWLEKAFLWEKRQLFRQLWLYYSCIGQEEKAQKYRIEERNEYLAGEG